MNNNVNNNNKPTVSGSINQIVGGFSNLLWASWDNTGGKVVTGISNVVSGFSNVVQGIKESSSKLSSLDDFSDVKKIDIEKREVNVPNNNNDEDIIIENNNVISGNVSKKKESYNSRKTLEEKFLEELDKEYEIESKKQKTDEEKFLEELDKEYEIESKKDEGEVREWILSEDMNLYENDDKNLDSALVQDIMSHKGGIKIKGPQNKIRYLLSLLSSYAKRSQHPEFSEKFEFPIIKELTFSYSGELSDAVSAWYGPCGLKSSCYANVERIVIESLKLDEAEILSEEDIEMFSKHHRGGVCEFKYLCLVCFDWKYLTLLKEIKIKGLVLPTNKAVNSEYSKLSECSEIFGLNFFDEREQINTENGWSQTNLKKIFLPKWLLEKVGWDREFKSYVCGLQKHPVSSVECGARFVGSTRNSYGKTPGYNDYGRYVEFIFE